MNARLISAILRGNFALLLVLLPLGCSKGGSSSGPPSGEAAHIAAAANAVKSYMTENKGKTPKSTDEIKAWAANNNIADDVLVSTRDHEPYLIFEVTMGGMGKQLILTEKTGVNGKKFMFSNMNSKRAGVEGTEEAVQNTIKGVTRGRRGPSGP